MNKLEHPCAETGAAVSGWVLVPREPTFAMASAGGAAIWDHASGNRQRLMENAYRAMIAVSPPPPSSHDGLREDGSASVAGAESEPCGLRTVMPHSAGWDRGNLRGVVVRMLPPALIFAETGEHLEDARERATDTLLAWLRVYAPENPEGA